jgi:hypothetical protein
MKLLIALGLLAAIPHTVALLATDMTLLSVLCSSEDFVFWADSNRW